MEAWAYFYGYLREWHSNTDIVTGWGRSLAVLPAGPGQMATSRGVLILSWLWLSILTWRQDQKMTCSMFPFFSVFFFIFSSFPYGWMCSMLIDGHAEDSMTQIAVIAVTDRGPSSLLAGLAPRPLPLLTIRGLAWIPGETACLCGSACELKMRDRMSSIARGWWWDNGGKLNTNPCCEAGEWASCVFWLHPQTQRWIRCQRLLFHYFWAGLYKGMTGPLKNSSEPNQSYHYACSLTYGLPRVSRPQKVFPFLPFCGQGYPRAKGCSLFPSAPWTLCHVPCLRVCRLIVLLGELSYNAFGEDGVITLIRCSHNHSQWPDTLNMHPPHLWKLLYHNTWQHSSVTECRIGHQPACIASLSLEASL